jgi:hypothetical protein
MDKRKFSIIYWWGYYSNKQAGVDKPFIHECDGDEINDSNGWNEDDITVADEHMLNFYLLLIEL